MTTSSEDAESPAQRARRVVLSSGLSQREVASRVGMDPTALSKALNGTRRLRDHELEAIAEVGRVPLRYLRTGAGREPAVLRRAERRRPRADAVGPDERRAQIREATARLIARRGFHNVRVSDIARESGTSTGTVHYHYATLDDALSGALFLYADRLHEQLRAAFADAEDTRERLRRLIEAQLPTTAADVDEWSVWVQSWNEAMLQPRLRETQRTVYARYRQVVVELLRDARREGLLQGADPEVLAARFTSMVDGLAIQLLAQTTDMTVDRMRGLLLDAFEPHLTLRSRRVRRPRSR